METMKANNYKAAVIGCGNIAGAHDEKSNIQDAVFTHAGAYRNVHGIKLIAATDVDRKRLAEFGGYWNVNNLFSDYKQMLNAEKYDVISVCLPDEIHFETIKNILSINPPRVIFAEKPLATNTSSLKELLALAKQSETQIIVNYQRRWEKTHVLISGQIKNGAFGAVQAVSGYYVKGLKHNGCTMINTLRLLISDILAVQALPPEGIGTLKHDDSFDFILFFENGAKASIQSCDKNGYKYSIFEIDIICEKGRFKLTENGEQIAFFHTVPYHSYPGFYELELSKEESTDMPRTMVSAVEHIVRLLRGEATENINYGEESLKDTMVIEAANRSRRQNWQRVEV